ncbi:GAF domain-containing protein [Marinilabiliaceae bacterium ANBcel2]|nr:GAF domain-containing protein [Marinilabiliaceae bacterium ANBcel2]
MQEDYLKGKDGRYSRLYKQLYHLVKDVESPVSRMATVAALLHYKMANFFWTGFYFLEEGELIVGPYQGPLACLKLQKGQGVCWAGINREESVIVDNVHDFPGHIACSSLSNSEIVVPVKDQNGSAVAVLDVDSKLLSNFDNVDKINLEKIVSLVYNSL